MSAMLAGYAGLLSLVLVNAVLAFSQYLVLRAGVFSLATAGIASLGAYAAAILAVRWQVPGALALIAAGGVGLVAGVVLSLPLARLRGVFQAIATLAFVQIVLSLALYAEPLTGGAMGFNAIPRLVDLPGVAAVFAIVLVLVIAVSRSRIGRAFDAIRQDETVAVSLGIAVVEWHRLAFALSGLIAGLGGGLMACRNYSLVPEDFGFPLLMAVLTQVVLGGRIAVAGPLVGAAVLTLLPEVARPLADYRMAVNGALLVLVAVYWPHGIVDTVAFHLRERALKVREAVRP